MNNRKKMIAGAGIVLMLLLLAAAFLKQSAYMLYAASIIPVFIVPFLPDIRSDQKVKTTGKPNGFQLYRIALNDSADNDVVVIDFAPGAVLWSKRRLYIRIDEEALPVLRKAPRHDAASLSALRFDLVIKSRKADWVGIELTHLLDRLSSFSFTEQEVGRLVIRIQDLRESRGLPAYHKPAASRKGLRA